MNTRVTEQEALIKEMHTKFGISYDGPPRSLDHAEKNFRVAALFEELEEFAQDDTLVGQYDALLDLMVFALGTMERMGYPLSEGFATVMACNLAKQVGNNPSKSNPGRGQYKGVDLVKPDGWTGPEDKLTEILINRSVLKKETLTGALHYVG
jgi:predicted HAD superfamily Cof-like phosphohydrolase